MNTPFLFALTTRGSQMPELNLLEMPAHPDLKPYVGALYYVNVSISGDSPERRCILLPHANVDLIINLGGPFSMERAGQINSVTSLATLHGPHPDATQIRRHGALSLLGVRLKLGVAAGFLNFPVKEISGRFISAESFWPNVQSELIEPVLAAENLRTKIQVFEKALARFFSKIRKTDSALRKAVKLVAQHEGDVEVAEIARQLKISRQTVKHKFDHAVGLSPKQFGKLRRFQSLLRNLSSNQDLGWSDLATKCGYYDQAHLIREFNSFTGFSPEKFLKLLARGEDLYFFEAADLTHYHMANRFKVLAGLG
jgi:AraC-like DNA-binding protein